MDFQNLLSSDTYNTYDETTRWQTGYGCGSDGTGCSTLITYENGVQTVYSGCKNATDISGCTGSTTYNTYDQDTGESTGNCPDYHNKESCNPEHPNNCTIIYND